jgi:hypothetical protein
MFFETMENYTMAIKYRGVKIVPVKITRFEVRTVDNRKLKSFSNSASARSWVDGYLQAVTELTPKAREKAPRKSRRGSGSEQVAETTA